MKTFYGVHTKALLQPIKARLLQRLLVSSHQLDRSIPLQHSLVLINKLHSPIPTLVESGINCCSLSPFSISVLSFCCLHKLSVYMFIYIVHLDLQMPLQALINNQMLLVSTLLNLFLQVLLLKLKFA